MLDKVKTHNALAERALLACLRTKAWSGRKKDKAVTAETTERYNAKDQAASVTKRLLECDEFDAVMAVITAAGETHRVERIGDLQRLDEGVGQRHVEAIGNVAVAW